MTFEIYKPRGERAKKQALVSLSKNSIVINKVAREKFNVDKIELAYDRDTNIIRISASESGQTIKKTKVFARGFFNYFNINKTGKFPAEYNTDQNALYVDLKKSQR
ncbi:hypothetical protein L7E55_12965 [Pelotomaculum isophthalicicum JI]|uniref:Uncharacterized protein n=1 Tax=Pelotomaculum isophthalicicum JI TaxID=947010 RepID=A0A9X4H3Q1_9FIRM|nr:hypothetical protein [Pelotomaculum isophthalicicum]MDF9409256.1 hypothetical protein [Pelotomaculum isophthalicicum JI]